jgi:hypothetical protein
MNQVDLPFIVRNDASFSILATEINERKQINREQSVKGYDSTGKVCRLSGRQALLNFDDCSLAFNIVDSATTRGHSDLLPKYLASINRCSDNININPNNNADGNVDSKSKCSSDDDRSDSNNSNSIRSNDDDGDGNIASEIDEDNWLAYVISPYSNGTYVVTGEKQWLCIDKDIDEAFFSLEEHNATIAQATIAINSSMGNCNDENIDKADSDADTEINIEDKKIMMIVTMKEEMIESMKYNRDMSGSVYTCTLSKGDFISVPFLWPHCVKTCVKTIGLSGYSTYLH